jgi:hypothetical protein
MTNETNVQICRIRAKTLEELTKRQIYMNYEDRQTREPVPWKALEYKKIYLFRKFSEVSTLQTRFVQRRENKRTPPWIIILFSL